MRTALLSIGLILATSAIHAQPNVVDTEASARSAGSETPDVNGIFASQDVIAKYSKYFDNIIVVNKAPDVQRAAIVSLGQQLASTYVKTVTLKDQNGKPYKKDVTVERWKVSTGTERWTCDAAKDGDGNVIGKRAVWTGTPTGFYPSVRPDIDHHSKAFHDSWMKYAFFFNDDDGVATHLGEEPQFFGKARASHGCVRMTEQDAKDIFTMTLLSGGPVDMNNPGFKGECPSSKQKSGAELQQCYANANARTKIYSKEIAAMVEQGAQEKGFEGSALPYAQMPQIPDLRRDGSFRTDATGNMKMKPGYRTLVIVECVTRDGKDCSSRPGERGPAPICTEEMQKRDQNLFDSLGDMFFGKENADAYRKSHQNGGSSDHHHFELQDLDLLHVFH